MSGNTLRHVLAVVTICALASFQAAGAEDAPGGAFRDNPAWTVSDGALTTQGPAWSRQVAHARNALQGQRREIQE